MARTDDAPHDPFAPPVPAFPVNRLRSAGIGEGRLAHLDQRFDEMTTRAARVFVNFVRTHPTREVAELFAAPDGSDIEAIAKEPRDRLVWLAASYGRPISGNRHELAAEIVSGRDIDDVSTALASTVDAADYPDPDDYRAAVDAAVPNRADDETDDDYLARLRAELADIVEVPAQPEPTDEGTTETGQEPDQGSTEGQGDTSAPPTGDEAPTGGQEPADPAPAEPVETPAETPASEPAADQPETDPAGDPIDPAAPSTPAPEGTDDGIVAEPPAPESGTVDEVSTDTTTPGDTPEPVTGDAPDAVEGDSAIQVEGDTVTAIVGDASPSVALTEETPAPKKAARRSGK